MVQTLVEHESYASEHRGHYIYVSEERSERTGGHLWRERVAETNWGKLRFLVQEDGQPLNGDRQAAEKRRIEASAADPEGFKRTEAARVDDEQHARQLLALLPKAFLFDTPQTEGEFVRIGIRPNPDYAPDGMEEKVMSSMQGSIVLDRQALRLHEVDMKLPKDVNLGLGFLATIHEGSYFHQVRDHREGIDWKTAKVQADFKGKALFLKSIARAQDAVHMDFQKIPDETTVAEAVALLEK